MLLVYSRQFGDISVSIPSSWKACRIVVRSAPGNEAEDVSSAFILELV